jgi:predicted hydrocarbon binding protein
MLDTISSLETENVNLKDQKRRLEWRFNHARNQYLYYLEKTIDYIPENERESIFHGLGRNCAKSLGWAQNYINNPEGFFEHMYKHSGENISFAEDRKSITVITKKRPCDCPLLKGKCIGGYFCECSIGWQMETYETILGKKVSVEIVESAFRGSEKCKFIVHV